MANDETIVKRPFCHSVLTSLKIWFLETIDHQIYFLWMSIMDNKLLLVDDEEGIRKVLGIALSDAGIRFLPQKMVKKPSKSSAKKPRRLS